MNKRILLTSTVFAAFLTAVVACQTTSEEAQSSEDLLCVDVDEEDDDGGSDEGEEQPAEDSGTLVPETPADPGLAEADSGVGSFEDGIHPMGPPVKPPPKPAPPVKPPPKPTPPGTCPPGKKPVKKDAGGPPGKDAGGGGKDAGHHEAGGGGKDAGHDAGVDCDKHCATAPPGPGVLCSADKLKGLTEKVNTACKTPGQKVSCNDQMQCPEIVQILDHADACAAARLERQKCFDKTCRVTCDLGKHDAQAQQYAQNAYGCKDLCISKSCGTDLCKLKHLAH